MSLIQQLIRSEELVLWHRYDAGSFHDFSEQGNDGTPGGTIIHDGGGVSFPTSTANVGVADAAELQITEGTLIVLGNFRSQVSTEELFIKRDAGGTNFDYYLAAGVIALYDGSVSRTLTTSVLGKKCLAVNIDHGNIPQGYINGLFAGAYSGVLDVIADDAPIRIGSQFNNTVRCQSPLWQVLEINRQLTASEHSVIYGELMGLQ